MKTYPKNSLPIELATVDQLIDALKTRTPLQFVFIGLENCHPAEGYCEVRISDNISIDQAYLLCDLGRSFLSDCRD